MPQQRRSRRGGRRRPAPPVAVIDLGTNNCRLLIAKPSAGPELRIVDSFSRIVRLGEGVAATGLLSDAAMTRTVAALKICADHIRAKGVRRVRTVGTEACRRAGNIDALIARVREEAGLTLEVISAEEEARLAAVGCAPLIDPEAQGALVFDIGGGSTELIWMRRDGDGETPRVLASLSVPQGVVTLAEQDGGVADRDGYARLTAELTGLIARARTAFDGAGAFDVATHHLLGTSGTVTTLAGISLGLSRYDRARVDASWHRCDDILAVIDRLVDLDPKGRAAMGCVGADRADLIVPGCALFAAIHALWPCERLRVADRGLREGMLRDLMARR